MITPQYLADFHELGASLRVNYYRTFNDLGVPAAGEFFGYDYTTIFG